MPGLNLSFLGQLLFQIHPNQNTSNIGRERFSKGSKKLFPMMSLDYLPISQSYETIAFRLNLAHGPFARPAQCEYSLPFGDIIHNNREVVDMTLYFALELWKV